MCMQCVGAVGAALQAVTVVGGPYAYKHYRRARAALGLRDTSVAAQEARAAASAEPPRGLRIQGAKVMVSTELRPDSLDTKTPRAFA